MRLETRVAQVIGKAVQGGVDTLLLNYYRKIDKSRVQFDFFMDGLDPTVYDSEIRNMGGRIYKLPPYDKNIRKNLNKFREIIQNNEYKIVHCHLNTLSVFWLREAKLAGVPVRIAHSHSTSSLSEGLRMLAKYSLRPFSKVYPTHFAACSEHASKWLFGKHLQKSGNVLIMHNAIDLEKFKFNPDLRKKTREKLNIDDRFVIGHVGRFVHQKNHGFLISLFKKIHAHDPTAVLMLVGDGRLKKETEDSAASFGLTDSVIFLGNRRNVHELFQAMDVFVLPSHYEGLPIVAVEAQAAGLPCILSDRITKEVILSDSATRLSLKSPLRIWEKNIKKYKSHKRNCNLNEQLSDNFNIENAASKLCDYYCGL